MSVFVGLPEIFTGTFGESVIYTPVSTGVPVPLVGIWFEVPVDSFVDGDVPTDDIRCELHVRAVDVPVPVEGDLVQRSKNGKTMKVVPPIRPDDKGMIAVTLAVTV